MNHEHHEFEERYYCTPKMVREIQLTLYHWGLPRDVIEKMGILKLHWCYIVRRTNCRPDSSGRCPHCGKTNFEGFHEENVLIDFPL